MAKKKTAEKKQANNMKQKQKETQNNTKTEENPQTEPEQQQAESMDKETEEVKQEPTEGSKEEKLQEENDQLNDKFRRLYSEFDNYRKRTNRERQELRKTASEDIIVTLLPVLDDFDRALNSIQDSKETDEVHKGFELIYTKFKAVLQQKGLEEMDSMEKEFNTDYHEAISYIPAPKEEMKGKVVEVTQKGYMLNGKVIRFAKVILGN